MSAAILSSPSRLESKPASRQPEPEIRIAGVTPFTTIDFPGHLAAVLYTQGCAWRCRYCHNPHLWPFAESPQIEWPRVLEFLESRKGLIDGVVFSGGEPTAWAGLGDAMDSVRALGFKTALHTSGMFPKRLREALRFCDWVGMDAKAPFSEYERITGIARSGEDARASVRLILDSGVNHEFRTTVHADLLGGQDVLELARELAGMGVRHYVVQEFRAAGCVDRELIAVRRRHVTVLPPPLEREIHSLFETFQIREA